MELNSKKIRLHSMRHFGGENNEYMQYAYRCLIPAVLVSQMLMESPYLCLCRVRWEIITGF